MIIIYEATLKDSSGRFEGIDIVLVAVLYYPLQLQRVHFFTDAM